MTTAVLQTSSFCDLSDIYTTNHLKMKNLKAVGSQLSFTTANANNSISSGNAPLRRSNSGTSCAAALLNPSSTNCNNTTTNQQLATLQQQLVAQANGMNNYNSKLTNQPLINLNDTLTTKQAMAALAQVTVHRKLDRSMSEPVERGTGLSALALLQQQQQAKQIANGGNGGGNSSRYKTELCRPYEESGSCKYGDKCQFAHGLGEVRSLARHPKYKTELCRTFHTTGLCPYGPRCHFIHNADEARRSSSSCSGDTPTGGRDIIRHDDGMGSAGNSPHSSDCEGGGSPPDSGFFMDDSAFSALSSLSSLSTPVTPTVANAAASLFSFHGNDFNRLSRAAARLNTQASSQSKTQQQNAYNRAFLHRQHSLGAATVYSASKQQMQLALDSRDNVFRDSRAISPPAVVLPSAVDLGSDVLPMSPPGSPTGSDTDSCSDGSGSNNTCSSPLDVSRNLRLPIFSQLAINNNNRLV